MSNPNPEGCCGVKTSCCEENIPDSLKLTVQTDCGNYEIDLPLVTNTVEETVWWNPDGKFECKIEEGGSCMEQTSVDCELSCRGDWELLICSEGLTPSNVSCDPFNVTFENVPFLCSTCFADATITITE